MVQAETYELANNEVRAITHYAMCRECKWQTAPAHELTNPLARARRHHEHTGHVVDACTTTAITIA